MSWIGRSRISDSRRVLGLLGALALLMLVQVSASLADGPGASLARIGRDLAAVRVQLDALPDRFVGAASAPLSFNAEIGGGDGEQGWQLAIAMAESAERGVAHVRRSLRAAGAHERADLALLLGVQISNVERALAVWREASGGDAAELALGRAIEALDRADHVFGLLRSGATSQPRQPARASGQDS